MSFNYDIYIMNCDERRCLFSQFHVWFEIQKLILNRNLADCMDACVLPFSICSSIYSDSVRSNRVQMEPLNMQINLQLQGHQFSLHACRVNLLVNNYLFQSSSWKK